MIKDILFLSKEKDRKNNNNNNGRKIHLIAKRGEKILHRSSITFMKRGSGQSVFILILRFIQKRHARIGKKRGGWQKVSKTEFTSKVCLTMLRK